MAQSIWLQKEERSFAEHSWPTSILREVSKVYLPNEVCPRGPPVLVYRPLVDVLANNTQRDNLQMNVLVESIKSCSVHAWWKILPSNENRSRPTLFRHPSSDLTKKSSASDADCKGSKFTSSEITAIKTTSLPMVRNRDVSFDRIQWGLLRRQCGAWQVHPDCCIWDQRVSYHVVRSHHGRQSACDTTMGEDVARTRPSGQRQLQNHAATQAEVRARWWSYWCDDPLQLRPSPASLVPVLLQ